MIYIIRNQHEYGPYEASDIARYVEEGRLLLNDRARDAESDVEGTVEELLAARGIRPRVRNRGTLMEQLRYIGHAFIFPKDDMERHHIMEDKRLLILAVVGLSLSIIMLLPIGGYLVFYAVSLYFATIWGLFFAYFFRTRQISKSKAVSTFFLTQLGVFIIFSGLNELNFFYAFTSAPFPLSILGYILGIGLTGTSVNPARSFGPALLAGGDALSQVWIFILAPLVGACLAALVFRCFASKEKEA